jgi:hypothetical protein
MFKLQTLTFLTSLLLPVGQSRRACAGWHHHRGERKTLLPELALHDPLPGGLRSKLKSESLLEFCNGSADLPVVD